jgi:hypothetical protein
MRRDLDLTARYVGFPPSLNFTLDDESLEIGGLDAEAVGDMLRAAAATGSVVVDPYPTSIAITDPFRSRAQLAAVLAEGYALPDWLQDWIPQDDAASEDGVPDDLRPIY